MNDMERDLRELFEERARHAESPAQAPELVLRRGRRREIRTLAMGVLASVVVIAMALAVSNFVRTPADTVPGGGQDLPERSTSIGGVPVTAPAGWTLIDDTPMLNTVATSSQSCSFTASGTEIGANGSPVATATPTADPSPSCTTEQTKLPGGVPFLQLANFDIPLMGSVCDWNGQGTTPVPNDGVALYVAAYPSGYDAQKAADACPGAERYGQTAGSNGYTFALGTNNGPTTLTMAAIAVAGPGASDADLAVIRSFFDQPIFGQVDPYVTLDGHRAGPGYVIAAGGTAEEGWRLEAGIGSYANSGRPMAASVFVSVAHRSETASFDASFFDSEDVDTVAGQIVQHGNLAAGTTGVDITGPDGGVTQADVYAWPAGLRDIADSQALDTAGGIWVATPPEEGDVTFTQPTATGPSPTASESPSGQLQTRLDGNANLVIYGNDLGYAWELRHADGQIHLYIDGNEHGSFPMVNGQWRVFDVEGGAFVVGIFDNSVDRLFVAKDPVGSTGLIIDGGFANAQDANGQPGRVWLIPLAGTGGGLLRAGNVTPLGWHITWPSVTNLHPDAVLRAGGDGITYSWSLLWRDDHCAQLEWQIPSSAWVGDCLPPWSDLQRNGGVPLVGGDYAQNPGDPSGIVLVLPADASIASFRTDGDQPSPECTTIRVESNFAGTQFCVFPLKVGTSAHLNLLDGNGNLFDSPIGITATPGRIELAQSGAAVSSTTPSP